MDKQDIYSEIEILINELETLVKSLATAREHIAENSTTRASGNLSEIEISKSFVNWKFTTENNYQVNKIIELKLVDGPFSHLEGHWKFDEIDEFNTQVTLYLEYKFDNKLIEMSIKPVFSNIMSSILDSFISEAFKLKSYD